MKFFIDTANLDQIREAAALGVLDGVTTNPSLMAKEGISGDGAVRQHYVDICNIVDGDVSAEVISTNFEDMVREGEELAALHDNIVVKVPMIEDGVKALRYFSDKGIRTNCTLVFSAGQALLAAKAGADYVSPFIGRLDDISTDGLQLISQIRGIYDNYMFKTEILAASVRHPSPRSPISARLMANLIERAGADRVLTMDLHAGQIQGFFDIPTDNLYAQPMIWRDIEETYAKQEGDVMIVSPDVGGVVRARRVAKLLDVELGIVDKRRPRANESVVMNVIGDVTGKHCILIDDIVDTAGTLCNAALALMERGARSVAAYCTHGVLSDPAVQRITDSVLSEVVVTNTIMPRPDVAACDKIRAINVAPMFAEAMRRITNEESVSTLFDNE